MKVRAAIYVRLSREDEEKIDRKKESRSIENQITTLKAVAQEQDFFVYQIYSDDGYSGVNFDRPAFKKLLKDMKRNKFDVLLLKDLSRLGRSLHKVGELIENVFPENGIRVISVNDNYDSNTYNDDMSIVFKSFLNDYYLREFKKKCKKAREHYAQTKHLNYYPKYGYRYDRDGQEIIDEYSANIVRRIYLSIAHDGVSCGTVAGRLNAEGVLTRSAYATQVLGLKSLHKQPADKWNGEKVWSIATDYEYCGHSINWGRHRDEEQILLKNTHCRIITEELFSTVQEKIKSRSKVIRKLDHLGKYIIDIPTGKNLLFSKKQQIYFLRNDNKKIYSIKQADIEIVISLELIYILEKYLDQYYVETERSQERGLERLNYEYTNLIETTFQGKIDKSSFDKKAKILLEKIKAIEAGDNRLGLMKKVSNCRKVLEDWKNNKDVDYKVIKLFLNKVEILQYCAEDNFCVTIKYKY